MKMPSARLFYMRPKSVLVLPTGTFHYVYTAQKKLAVAGDFLNASAWDRRVSSCELDNEYERSKKDVDLCQRFIDGVKLIELPRLIEGNPPPREYLQRILDWAEQLKGEGVALHQVRPALAAVWEHVNTDRQAASENPWASSV